MPDYEGNITKGKTIPLTIQPTVGGIPTNNAENPAYVENGSAFLEVTHISDTAPFVVHVKAVGDAEQNPLLRIQYDGRKGDGVVPLELLAQFHIVDPDSNGGTITAGPEF